MYLIARWAYYQCQITKEFFKKELRTRIPFCGTNINKSESY